MMQQVCVTTCPTFLTILDNHTGECAGLTCTQLNPAYTPLQVTPKGTNAGARTSLMYMYMYSEFNQDRHNSHSIISAVAI